MSKMAHLIEESEHPWEYVKEGKEQAIIPGHVLDDIRVPLGIDMQLPDSGGIEETSKESQPYKNLSGYKCIRVGKTLWTPREDWVAEQF